MSLKKNKKILKTTLGKAPSESEQEPDLSHLGKPIATSINGLRHVLSLIQTATSEVKRLITHECDIMYECRVCRSIFRSLANFVMHKRNYCRDSYNPLDHTNCRNRCQDDGYYVQHSENRSDSPQNAEWESNSQSKPKENRRNMASILQKLLEKQEDSQAIEEVLNQDISNDSYKEMESNENKTDVALESIQTTDTAVFQTMFKNMVQEHRKMDFMKSEVMELHGIFASDEAVIGPDGKILQFETDKRNAKDCIPKNNLVCTVCNQKFSTRKTLTYHIKYKHNDTRMVYPCPVCKDQFANAWCVFRHLYKIHRKTTTQIRKMRDHIHASAFRKDQEPLKKQSTITSSTSETYVNMNDNSENQWMENIEGDNDFQMCGGCGRRFERRAALHSHSQLCTKRIAICNTIKENSSKILQDEKQEAKVAKTTKYAKLASIKGAEKRKPLIIRRKCDTPEGEKKNTDDCSEIQQISESTSSSDSETDTAESRSESSNSNAPETTVESAEKDTQQTAAQIPTFEMTEVLNIIGIPVADENSNKDAEEVMVEVEDANVNQTVDDESISFAPVVPIKENISSTPVIPTEENILCMEITEEIAPTMEVICVDFSENKQRQICDDENEQHKLLNGKVQDNVQEIILLHNKSEDEEIEIETPSVSGEKRKRSLSIDSLTTEINKKIAPAETSLKGEITLETKAEKYMDRENLICLPCNITFESVYHLMLHMSQHFTWVCYQCSKCMYMCYFKTTCAIHLRKVHKMPVTLINNMVLPVPNWKTLELSTDFRPLEQCENIAGHSASSETCEEDKDVLIAENSLNAENPDTRKMIMEVIFGSNVDSFAYSNAAKSTKEEKQSNSVDGSSRPVRNRNKVVQEDFLYDMKEAVNLSNSLSRKVSSGSLKQRKTSNHVPNQITSHFTQRAKPLKVYERKVNRKSIDKPSKPLKVYIKKTATKPEEEQQINNDDEKTLPDQEQIEDDNFLVITD